MKYSNILSTFCFVSIPVIVSALPSNRDGPEVARNVEDRLKSLEFGSKLANGPSSKGSDKGGSPSKRDESPVAHNVEAVKHKSSELGNIFAKLPSSKASDKSGNPSKREESQAVDILNFALSLEHLENAYYHERLALYSPEEFIAAGYPTSVRGRFEQIALHEKTHVELLSSAISAAGGKATKPCEYKFPDHDVKSFIELSEDFETVGTSAYNGALGLLGGASKGEYETVAGSILTIEAQQATWINSAVLGSYPWSTSLGTPLSANEAFTIASGFIVKCPSDNPPLIAHPFPMLTVESSAPPGGVAKLSFKDSNKHGKPLFAAFRTGTATLFSPINDEGEVKVPEGLIGTVYILVTSENGKVTDETIVAGPAIARFSYPSNS